MGSPLSRLVDESALIKKLDLREEGKRRIIAGYANVSDLVDSQDESVTHEALVNAYRKWKNNPDYCFLSLLHSNIALAKPIFEDVIDSKGHLHKTGVDDTGLYVVAEVRDDVTLADETWRKIESGEYRGFSIGGRNLNPQPAVCDGDKCVRQITDLELYEIAIVDQPANRVSLFNMLKRDDLAKLSDATKDIKEQVLTRGAVKISKNPCPQSGHYHVLVNDGADVGTLFEHERFEVIDEPVEGEDYIDLFDIALLRPESALTGEARNSGCDPLPLKAEQPDEPDPPGGLNLDNKEKEEKQEEVSSEDDSGISEEPVEDAEKQDEAVAPITLETLAADLARVIERLKGLEKGVVKVEKSVEPAPEEPAPVETPVEAPAETPPAEQPAEEVTPTVHVQEPEPQPEPAPTPEPTTPEVKPVEATPTPEPTPPAPTTGEIETRGIAPPQASNPQGLDLAGVFYAVSWNDIHEAQTASENRK